MRITQFRCLLIPLNFVTEAKVKGRKERGERRDRARSKKEKKHEYTCDVIFFVTRKSVRHLTTAE